MEYLPDLGELDFVPHLVALTIAFLLALPIGWNREREDRSAGLRTFPLVAVASCGFVQAAEKFSTGDIDVMGGVLEGLITGVGFIGGGAILKHGTSVLGTATAASLWVTGAIGVSVGLGALDVAVMLSLITGATLFILSPMIATRGDVAAQVDENDENGVESDPDDSVAGKAN
ncbi:MAG: MgtC/SapB family protein [Tsuneonella sp.]